MRKFFEIHGIFASLAFVAFLLAPNSAQAEQSGWFMGVQAGYGVGERQRQLEAVTKRTTNIQNSRYVFADEFGNINTIQKEERLPEITGRWTHNANEQYKGAGNDQKVNGYLPSPATILNTYKIVGTYTFDPTDPSTYKFTSKSAQSVKDAIANYAPGGANYDRWTAGTTNENQNTRSMVELNDSLKGVNAGLLAGYKHFFSTKFGLRVYGLLDYSYYKGSDSAALKKMQSYNANLNLDVLYNLIDKNDKIMGVFAGLSVGGAQYISSKTRLASDIDIGLNFGLRFGAGKHSIELFSRIGGLFVGAEHYGTSDTAYSSEKMWLDSSENNWLNFETYQPSSVQGIRVCPASVADCGAGGTTAAFNGYEKGNSTTSTGPTSQYRYRVFRYQYQDNYIRETTEAAAGSRMVDSYKQPYKIGIRYIYSF